MSERGGERVWLGGAAVFCIVMLTGFVCAGLLVTDAVEVEEEEAEAPPEKEEEDEGPQQIDVFARNLVELHERVRRKR